MIHRLANLIATALAFAMGIALVNYWWALSACFFGAMLPVVSIAEWTSRGRTDLG